MAGLPPRGARLPPPRTVPDSTAASGRAPLWRVLLAAGLAVFSLLPVYEWLPGVRLSPMLGVTTLDWYRNTTEGWLSGTAIVLGMGFVLLVLGRRVAFLAPGTVSGWAERVSARRGTFVAIAALALLVYVTVALTAFGGRPLIIDEITQLLQARIYAGGRLWEPTAAHPEFLNSLLMVDHEGRHFSQMSPGASLVLAVFELLRMPWLTGPVTGAIAVWAFADMLLAGGEDRKTTFGAALLLAFAPFALFMSGSYMNHVPTLMWCLLGGAAAARVARGDARRPALLAAWCGFAFGMAAIIRSVEGLAFALPAAIWLLALVAKRRLPPSIVPAGIAGVAIPFAFLAWVNLNTTGAPFLLGYVIQWGAEHGLGFHASSPWGPQHTPIRGVGLTSLYFLRLNLYLFEAPIPSLLPAFATLALWPRFRAVDRYLLAVTGLVVGLYWYYWFDGFWLGPRFYYSFLPIATLLTARLPALLRARLGQGDGYRFAMGAALTAVLVTMAALVPQRWHSYSTMFPSMRWNADSASREAGIDRGLVFVRETWGAQLLSRMWALGMQRTRAERLYFSTDLCILDEAVARLERDGTRGAPAERALLALGRDSARTVASPFSADTTQRYLPGTRYTPRCLERLRGDSSGTTLLPPRWLARREGIVYVRDLHERNLLVAEDFGDRPWYLLKPDGAEPGTMPRFVPLDRDSARRAWRARLAGDTTALQPTD